MNNDLISREALKKAIEQYQIQWNKNCETDIAKWDSCESILAIINHAPTVEANVQDLINEYNKGFNNGYKSGKSERPQGEITNEDIQQAIKEGFANGYEMAKEKIIHSIAKQYSEHNELVPIWLSIGDIKNGAV